MPLIVFSLSRPSVLWTIGSRRIFSSCCSSSSSLDAVVIFSPFLLITVTAEIRCRVVAGSAGGLSKVALAVVTFVCFPVLPSGMSSGRVLFGGVNAGVCDAGVGSAGLWCADAGDVARGASIIVGRVVGSAVLASECFVCSGALSMVCVSVVVCFVVLGRRCGIIAGGIAVGAFATGVQGYALIASRSCLSKLSGATSLLTVRALITLLVTPMMCSFVAVSLPSQMPLKKRCSSFGSAFAVGTMYCIVSPKMHSGALCSLFQRL